MTECKMLDKVTTTPEFERLSKVLYLDIILRALKTDPGLWEKFSHEKQVELHKIKKELDIFYMEEKSNSN